eukprot:3428697-Prymnesium_polylepis.1
MAGAQAMSTALAYWVRFSLRSGARKYSPTRWLLRSGGRRSSTGTFCFGNIETYPRVWHVGAWSRWPLMMMRPQQRL